MDSACKLQRTKRIFDLLKNKAAPQPAPAYGNSPNHPRSLPPPLMHARHGLHLLDAISDVAPEAWDALLPSDAPPCLRHAYLHALEASGCVCPETGWTPRHATLWADAELVAAMPLYLKTHSWGEYVFDWAWAEAYHRHGLDYYPKWLSAIPFTPIPGPRLLGRSTASRQALLTSVIQHARQSGLSSLHLLFPMDDDLGVLENARLSIRHGVQFHWRNADPHDPSGPPYRDFDAFLASLNHDKRKKIRQERRRAATHGLSLRWEDGHSATTADWAFLYRCYATTYALHRSTPYLSPAFFDRLASDLPGHVRLLLAERGQSPVASAFFLCDDHTLYGRYWGATENLPFLHFELCYYQAIEYCIQHGLQRFEGGAQGEHKLARGLQPVRTHSAHWIADPRFRTAVDDYLTRERGQMDFYLDELAEHAPFKAPAKGGA